MVAASTATPAAARTRNPKNPRGAREELPNPTRPPLIPSEKDNAAVSRRPRTKDVASRYLSPHAPSCPSSSSTTTTISSSSTTNSSCSSSSTPSSRRYPSPLLAQRPPSTPASALLPSAAPKRSQSVDRTRPVTPRPDQSRSVNVAAAEASLASRALCTTRSLSVSFQGESFFFQTSKAKAETPNSTRKPTPDRRRAATTPTRSSRNSVGGDHQMENSNSRSGEHHLWPAARAKKSNPLMRSLDYSLDKTEPIFATVRLLQHSLVFEEGRRASVDGGDLSACSDTDSVSSGSNSGVLESGVPTRARVTPRGISVPARFWQETNSRLRRLPEPGSPLPTHLPRVAATPKLAPVKKSLVDSPTLSPTAVSSPLRGHIRPSSPCKTVSSPLRTVASPLRTRGNGMLAGSVAIGQPGNAPSIISFAAEVRRGKKGESRIEEAHLLRLLHNHHLQWRYVNARATSSLSVQSVNAEKNVYNAWITTTEMRDSVTIKKVKLHLLRQDMKLGSILKEQITYLEEWSLVDREHSSSLSGAMEALKASTLRLPVVGGARADIRDVKEAVGSIVDVLQAIGSSTCSVLLKVEEMSSLVSEVAKLAAQEQALLDQSRDLLCSVAAMHVKQCSLRGHLLQLKHTAS